MSFIIWIIILVIILLAIGLGVFLFRHKIYNQFKNLQFKKTRAFKQGLKVLKSKADRLTNKNFYHTHTYFLHINSTELPIVDEETKKQKDIDLFIYQGKHHKQYLSDETYVLETKSFSENKDYKSLLRFSHHVSMQTGKMPIIVYSLDYQKINDDQDYISTAIMDMRKCLQHLLKIYKQLPVFIINLANAQQHPSYNAFITCTKSHNLPLIIPSDANDLNNALLSQHQQQIKEFADQVLLVKNPKLYLRYNVFINDVFDLFKSIDKEYKSSEKYTKFHHMFFYVSPQAEGVHKSLFQRNIYAQKYHSGMLAKIFYVTLSACFVILGGVFIKNIIQYNQQKNQYVKQISTIQPSATNNKMLTNDYNQAYYNINHNMYFNWLYPNALLSHELNEKTADYVQNNILIPALKSKDTAAKKMFLLMTLYASQSKALRNLILNNLQDWATSVNIEESLLKTYVNSSHQNDIPSLTTNYVENISFKDQNILKNVYILVESYIESNPSINLKTLNTFFADIYLPIRQKYLINQFMTNIYPNIQSNIDTNNNAFFKNFEHDKHPVSDKTLEDIDKIKSIVNQVQSLNINYFSQAISTLLDINQKVNKISDLNTKKGLIWHKAILLATENTLLNKLSTQEHYYIFNKDIISESTINIANSGDFNGNIPIIFSTTGIKQLLIPEIKKYNKLLSIFNQLKIPSQKLTDYYNIAIENYTRGYIQAYINMISNYKHNIDPDNIQTSLLLISSETSEFNNMLATIHKNTIFSKKLVEEIPELEIISNYFSNINSYIGQPKNIQEYENIFLAIVKDIENAENKQSTLNKIALNLLKNNKQSQLYQLRQLLNKYKIDSRNQKIFIAPLLELISIEKPFIKAGKLNQWNTKIISLLDKYKNYFPFNPNSQKIISIKKMNLIFSPKGEFWSYIHKDMSGIFKNKQGRWELTIPDLFGKKGKQMIRLLNKVQNLTNTLWTKNGKPKSIMFNITFEPLSNNILNDNRFIKLPILNVANHEIISLSTKQQPEIVNYNWAEESTSSVQFIDNKQELNTIKSYSGAWSFLLLLRAANQSNEVYTWSDKQSGAKIQFSIHFNNIFNSFNNQNL